MCLPPSRTIFQGLLLLVILPFPFPEGCAHMGSVETFPHPHRHCCYAWETVKAPFQRCLPLTGRVPSSSPSPRLGSEPAFAWCRSVGEGLPHLNWTPAINRVGSANNSIPPGHTTRALPHFLPEDSLQSGLQAFGLSDSLGAAGRGIKGTGAKVRAVPRVGGGQCPVLSFLVGAHFGLLSVSGAAGRGRVSPLDPGAPGHGRGVVTGLSIWSHLFLNW